MVEGVFVDEGAFVVDEGPLVVDEGFAVDAGAFVVDVGAFVVEIPISSVVNSLNSSSSSATIFETSSRRVVSFELVSSISSTASSNC